jgi:hemerythrin
MTALQGQAVILDVSAEMVEFLADWLTKHVAESDLDYVPYLEK